MVLFIKLTSKKKKNNFIDFSVSDIPNLFKLCHIKFKQNIKFEKHTWNNKTFQRKIWVMTLIKAYSDSECFQLYVIPKISTL